MKSKKSIGVIVIALIIIVTTICFAYWPLQTQNMIAMMNRNLDVEDIKFGMLEEDVFKRWGQGEYIYGFGGYGRDYPDKKSRISFSNDSDNDLYGKVGSIEFTNPEFAVFGIRVGEDRVTSIEKLKLNRFKLTDYSDDIYARGEFTIALRGTDRVEYIQIWFMDKDLKDRNY